MPPAVVAPKDHVSRKQRLGRGDGDQGGDAHGGCDFQRGTAVQAGPRPIWGHAVHRRADLGCCPKCHRRHGDDLEPGRKDLSADENFEADQAPRSGPPDQAPGSALGRVSAPFARRHPMPVPEDPRKPADFGRPKAVGDLGDVLRGVGQHQRRDLLADLLDHDLEGFALDREAALQRQGRQAGASHCGWPVFIRSRIASRARCATVSAVSWC